MTRKHTALLMACLCTSAAGQAAAEKIEVQAPFTATTPSKTLNARFDATKRFKEIPIITAKRYYTDYMDNEAAADIKYKDKPFIITGPVARIAKDFMDETYLSFWGDKYGLKSVDVHLFPEQFCGKEGNYSICGSAQRAATLKKNDKIKLECFGSAMMVQTPQAAKCILAP